MNLLKETSDKITTLNSSFMDKARARQNILTKPKGSLGRLEDLSIQLAGIQGKTIPDLTNKAIFTFAGDHHVVYEEDIASAPIEVTAQQVSNFVRGGGAVNALAKHCGARVIIIDMGVATTYQGLGKVKNRCIGKGASNISRGPAMSPKDAIKSIENGMKVVLEEMENGLDIIGIGEMGIGNTTPSSAIFSLYTGISPEKITGPGAGIDDDKLKKKIEVVKRALEINKPDKNSAIDVLSKIGGFELGGMAGAMLAAAANNIPVVIDGFISTAAAFIAISINPLVEVYLILSHNSAETGYSHAAGFLEKKPLLDLGFRLGEGTGAALGISLCDAAVAALRDMSTFDEAGVLDVKEL